MIQREHCLFPSGFSKYSFSGSFAKSSSWRFWPFSFFIWMNPLATLSIPIVASLLKALISISFANYFWIFLASEPHVLDISIWIICTPKIIHLLHTLSLLLFLEFCFQRLKTFCTCLAPPLPLPMPFLSCVSATTSVPWLIAQGLSCDSWPPGFILTPNYIPQSKELNP